MSRRPDHPALAPDPARFEAAWAEFTERMAGNHPFHHPRYAGQMLKPPHPVAIAAYTAAMHVNPNNHALDGGPATSAMELEVMAWLTEMFGLPDDSLGHLTSSGTIANLEALWVARELHPGKAVVHGANAHYTHERMCAVLGDRVVRGAVRRGRPDRPGLVEKLCATGDIGTVVVTAGTTGTGTVDDIARAVALRERFGVRVHVDAAYGGFFTLLAREGLVSDSFLAIGGADSVVVDPHKHGLQPYGCGAVLFRDPGVGRLYKHDSPYTYFTSGDLHLGEISLECSRAGAAAAALWLTLRALDLAPILAAGVRAARAWAALIEDSDALTLFREPELDIVTYFPTRGARLGDRRRERARARRRDGGPRPGLPEHAADRRARVRRAAPRRRDGRRRRARAAQRADEARARVARALAAPARHCNFETVSAKRPV